MSISEKIIQKLDKLKLPEDKMKMILDYIDFMEYQEWKEKDLGLNIAKERSEAYEQGKSHPISKQEFWENLKKRLG